MWARPLAVSLMILGGCASGPSDDPADYGVPEVPYTPSLSEPRFVVPSRGLPPEVEMGASNNNLDVVFHDGRLFFAWRTSEHHWAGPDVRMEVVSSEDEGQTFVHEDTIALGKDVREPRFVSLGGRLFLYFFNGGTNFFEFRPEKVWRTERLGPGEWSAPVEVLTPNEVIWDVKVRGGRAYLTSYVGNHYMTGTSEIDVLFRVSDDGERWAPVNPARPVVYHGGVSETAFEVDVDGGLWIVTRNEDGDASGFGSHLCYAPPADWSDWRCPTKTDPERYDSPEMFRHGREIYLVARRDLGGPFERPQGGLDFDAWRIGLQADYWNRPKRTALYRIDQAEKKVVWVFDLPSAGDTAYAAVVRRSEHEFLVANYTSPLDDLDISWSEGQGSEKGTWIYFATITFTPAP